MEPLALDPFPVVGSFQKQIVADRHAVFGANPKWCAVTENTPLEVLEELAADVVLADRVDVPDWRDTYQTWMAYVPDELRQVWSSLSRETRLAIVVFCDELVSRENVE